MQTHEEEVLEGAPERTTHYYNKKDDYARKLIVFLIRQFNIHGNVCYYMVDPFYICDRIKDNEIFYGGSGNRNIHILEERKTLLSLGKNEFKEPVGIFEFSFYMRNPSLAKFKHLLIGSISLEKSTTIKDSKVNTFYLDKVTPKNDYITELDDNSFVELFLYSQPNRGNCRRILNLNCTRKMILLNKLPEDYKMVPKEIEAFRNEFPEIVAKCTKNRNSIQGGGQVGRQGGGIFKDRDGVIYISSRSKKRKSKCIIL